MKFRWWHETILAVLIVGLLGYAFVVEPSFVTLRSQLQLSSHMWEMALMALPMLLIIITGGIDLSVGSTVALTAVVIGLSYQRGVPLLVACPLAVVCGTALGWVNGWFVARLKVHPLIVTLATMAAFRGVAEGISLAKPVTGFPEGFKAIANGAVAGIPYKAFIFLAFFVAVAAVLAKTPLGRSIYAIGHNEKAAEFSGIRVARIKIAIYAFAGFVAGLTAMLLVSYRNNAKADLGTNLELEVITAVVLGGASINGGRGNVVGLLLGIVLIHEMREFINYHWNENELALLIGALLIASVLLHRLLTRKSYQEEA